MCECAKYSVINTLRLESPNVVLMAPLIGGSRRLQVTFTIPRTNSDQQGTREGVQ